VSPRSPGPSYRFVEILLRLPLGAVARRTWAGGENIPAEGGFVACANHLTYVDPLTLGHFLYDHAAPPRFLAKASLFRIPLFGRLVVGTGQIPVTRGSAEAGHAYQAAVEAVRAGECVVVYPEATLTRDPDLWPMGGKTGAARVALTTGCPIIPIAQWGPQDLLAPYGKVPRLLPRPHVRIAAGPPVDLSAFRGRPADAGVLREATSAILDDITDLLRGLRGETPPAGRWDPRERRRVLTTDTGGTT
jgi:1-acyl-sn-glycerol-3-phosphate acyltransferase